jgi:GH24 family phage-related lysozyme (muramidase)
LDSPDFARKKSLTPAVAAPSVGVPEIAPSEIPQKAIDLIKEFEGCELSAYDDGVGVWTIGYGATFYEDGSKVKAGDSFSQGDAEDLLKFHLKKFWDDLAESTPEWSGMTESQRATLLSFSFNTGWRYDADGFNTLNKCIEQQNLDGVPAAIALYVNPGTSTEAGLRRRRKAEGALWNGH